MIGFIYTVCVSDFLQCFFSLFILIDGNVLFHRQPRSSPNPLYRINDLRTSLSLKKERINVTIICDLHFDKLIYNSWVTKCTWTLSPSYSINMCHRGRCKIDHISTISTTNTAELRKVIGMNAFRVSILNTNGIYYRPSSLQQWLGEAPTWPPSDYASAYM